MNHIRPAMIVCTLLCTPSFASPRTDSMVFPGRDWEEATPESQDVDPEKINKAVRYLRENSGPDGVGQLVIVRNGRMIWRGTDIDEQHGIWSCTKSFTSTVLGLLIDDGKCRLDEKIKDYLPEMAAAYPEVTLRHFATMTSGYRAVGDSPRGTYVHGPSSTPFHPDGLPLFAAGSRYAYWDSAMNQFAHVLTRIAKEPMEDLFQRRIADPIGMDRNKWDWGDFGQVDGISVNGGSGNSGKNVTISSREMARFGLLMLNRGVWNGRQLMSPKWIDAATSVQVLADVPLGGPLDHGIAGAKFPIDGRGVYGFNWWVNGLRPDGTRKWTEATSQTFAASGYNNNDMFVVPEWNIVIVRLGLDEQQMPITDATYGTFLGKIGESIGRTGNQDLP